MRRNSLYTLNIPFMISPVLYCLTKNIRHFLMIYFMIWQLLMISLSLDHNIPTPCNYNAVETEFELFYHSTHLRQNFLYSEDVNKNPV